MPRQSGSETSLFLQQINLSLTVPPRSVVIMKAYVLCSMVAKMVQLGRELALSYDVLLVFLKVLRVV